MVNKTEYYTNGINEKRCKAISDVPSVWAKSDVDKVNCAKKNGLNYKVFYKLNEVISEKPSEFLENP